MDLDLWILKVKEGQHLSEDELQLLCEYVFTKDVDRETAVLLGARASRVENQDSIDACIVGMLADPKEVSSTGMFVSLLVVAVSFYIKDAISYDSTLYSIMGILSVIGVVGMIIAFSLGMGPIPWVNF